jgi:tripeptidyl-peptidase-1
MAVAEFQGQYFKPDDLAAFSEACHRDVNVSEVIGDERPIPGVEAELDIEYIRAVSPGTPLTVVYSSTYSLLNWVTEITSLPDSPAVHSVSYGNDEKQQTGASYIYTCNTAFMKAGAAGLSIIFASGDQGVCGRRGCGGFLRPARFSPDFPADSPYITAVGGTDFVTDDIGDEMAWTDSGGGFSDYFPIPSYQAYFVEKFKADSASAGLLPEQSLWNNTGRGYPDVAALGGQKAPYCVKAGFSFEGVAGTSASCPVFAGIVARLNGMRLAKGKPALGFLNPFLYANPEAFNDVKAGRNSGGPNKNYGFSAIPGWDAASGLGTPDFEKLSQLI